jgi:hypothetical protein
MEDPHKVLVPLNTLQKLGQVFTPNKVLSSTHEMTDPGTRSEVYLIREIDKRGEEFTMEKAA